MGAARPGHGAQWGWTQGGSRTPAVEFGVNMGCWPGCQGEAGSPYGYENWVRGGNQWAGWAKVAGRTSEKESERGVGLGRGRGFGPREVWDF
jgi:hypothetical protein